MAGDDPRPTVELLIRSPALRDAVEAYLFSSFPFDVVPRLNETERSAVVVTTSSDIAPADCERLVVAGARVLVLLVFASDALADAYRSAGVEEVLLMGDEQRTLADAVRSMLPVPPKQD